MGMEQEFSAKASEFENTYGYGVLIEMYLIGVMNFLVDLGFITQDDLSKRIIVEMDKFTNAINKQKEIDKQKMSEQQNETNQFSTTAPKEDTQSFAEFIKSEKEK